MNELLQQKTNTEADINVPRQLENVSNDNQTQLRCPSNHQLTICFGRSDMDDADAYDGGNAVCDLCTNVIQLDDPNLIFIRCSECRYDVCRTCSQIDGEAP